MASVAASTVNLSPELIQRLDTLAAKLNVAASEIWKMYLRQAYVSGWLNLAGVLFGVGLLSGVVMLWGWCNRTVRQRNKERSILDMPSTMIDWTLDWEFADAYGAPVTIVTCLGITVGFILVFMSGMAAIQTFASPGYTALKLLLSDLHG
jgi:hypothetical protein